MKITRKIKAFYEDVKGYDLAIVIYLLWPIFKTANFLLNLFSKKPKP